MVIVWMAPLTDHIASGVTAEKNIAQYRYHPIYANIAQFPVTHYRYRSNPNVHRKMHKCTPFMNWSILVHCGKIKNDLHDKDFNSH